MAFADAVDRIIAGNRVYSKLAAEQDPNHFVELSKGQAPEVLWIGCADSRIPETTVCHSKPGELFVHRNIANCVHADDINAASVVEYAVAHLKVQKVVVCGHTKCGGANAALGDADLGTTLNTWLHPVRELRRKHKAELEKLPDDDARAVRVAELNVHQSIDVLKHHPAIKKAMNDRGLSIHGLIYDLGAGELRLLEEAGGRKSNGLWSPAL
ncbi:carbonic anhydrase [Aaosphaeria arxii CBS 175.79]|uniref:Carbonic anhydrase n=1 Tax=Aaosphaeria arxii CBS 175.79 TaxID=1450172 RepID=A0A6A5Y5D8_9PLEO|nr:carbonic anhydrase [Aaosphaeria arxii CBS 175.79]KAF2020708.1 carbonic anhydrase [Aaosphaeria arxii CBS 175.79]